MQATTPFLLLVLLAACAGDRTRRVDIGDDDVLMGTGLESADVESVASLANTLLAVPQLTGPAVREVPTVAIHPVTNRTRHDFDGELLVRRIRQRLTEVAEGRVRFVTRDDRNLDVIERERQDKRAGEYSSTKQETKTGADFYLTGKASSVSKTGGGMASDAIWIDFQLIDAENGEIVWENAYKTKKVGPDRVRYR